MEQQFVLLGTRKGLLSQPLPGRISVCHDRADLEAFLDKPKRRATWVSFSRSFTDILLEGAVSHRSHFQGSNLLTLSPPRPESIQALLDLFEPVYGLVDDFRWLPADELLKVILRDDAAGRFIGGCADSKTRLLTLLRGNLTILVAPFAAFPETGEGTKPDFSRLGFTDYGHGVTLGEYEAASDAILYELDPRFRRELNKQRRQADRSFGAALMRLRKQRRLRREDFGPLSARQIARIERNEIGKPRAKTLHIISERLGVAARDIGSY